MAGLCKNFTVSLRFYPSWLKGQLKFVLSIYGCLAVVSRSLFCAKLVGSDCFSRSYLHFLSDEKDDGIRGVKATNVRTRRTC